MHLRSPGPVQSQAPRLTSARRHGPAGRRGPSWHRLVVSVAAGRMWRRVATDQELAAGGDEFFWPAGLLTPPRGDALRRRSRGRAAVVPGALRAVVCTKTPLVKL